MSKSLRPLQKCTPSDRREESEREARRRFIAARNRLGLSQLETSARLGVHRSSVEDWERGAKRLPSWALVALEKEAA
jgi:DNA-binding transcriptional regulator YiaG